MTDFVGAAFPIILLWNAKLSLRTKVALNMLMGLGVVTGVVCIVRTSYSWEILSNDVTWVGVGNALTRMLVLFCFLPSISSANVSSLRLEVNFGIIGACAPIMRPLYLHLRSRITPRQLTLSSTQGTTPSQLQWFTPPSTTPWYKRIFRAPAPTDKLDGRPEGPDVSHNPIPDPTAKPAIKWPKRQIEKLDRRRHEKPENVTWAKNDPEAKFSDSFDLPLQGPRKSEYNGNEDDVDPDAFGTYRYHRGWV